MKLLDELHDSILELEEMALEQDAMDECFVVSLDNIDECCNNDIKDKALSTINNLKEKFIEDDDFDMEEVYKWNCMFPNHQITPCNVLEDGSWISASIETEMGNILISI